MKRFFNLGGAAWKTVVGEAAHSEALLQDGVDEMKLVLVLKTWKPIPANHLEHDQIDYTD
jgi:hypothetical protein